jgi:uncharacterized protein (TIGR03437 family)
LIAQHGDYSLVTAQNPAHPGEVLTMYLVGMGATDPPVPTGVASPANPVAYANVKPELSIGGAEAEVLFWGLTPGSVGLYQINFRVPPGTQPGDREVIVRQGAARANVTTLAVGP